MTRDEWESCENAYTLMRCIGGAHVRGTITRRRLVQVTLRCIEPIAYLLSDKSLTALADLTAWSHGADDVDLVDVIRKSEAQYTAARSAYAAADYAAAYGRAALASAAPAATLASVALAAWAAASAVAYAANAAAYAACDAACDAAHGADAWAAEAAAKGALCDVIRDAIAFEEIQ
jgi:hypothetical protein